MELGEERPAPPTKEDADGKFTFGEIYNYLRYQKYPEGATKLEKNSLRRRVKFFRLRHAIAFAVTLCAGKDPHACSYEQSQMRHHLYQCLEKGELTEFPAMKKPKRHFTRRVKSTRPVQVYCTCRLPWDKTTNFFGDLVECGKCTEWFHQKCMDIPDAAISDPSYSWFCTSH